jgi:hypothetical protein
VLSFWRCAPTVRRPLADGWAARRPRRHEAPRRAAGSRAVLTLHGRHKPHPGADGPPRALAPALRQGGSDPQPQRAVVDVQGRGPGGRPTLGFPRQLSVPAALGGDCQVDQELHPVSGVVPVSLEVDQGAVPAGMLQPPRLPGATEPLRPQQGPSCSRRKRLNSSLACMRSPPLRIPALRHPANLQRLGADDDPVSVPCRWSGRRGEGELGGELVGVQLSQAPPRHGVPPQGGRCAPVPSRSTPARIRVGDHDPGGGSGRRGFCQGRLSADQHHHRDGDG